MSIFEYEQIPQKPPQELIDKYYHGLRSYWHPVARSADLNGGTAVSVTLLEEDIVLCRLDGAVRAFPNVCRHFQARLSNGFIEKGCKWFDGDVIRCSYHGWAYRFDGQCVDIPQRQDGKRPPSTAGIKPLLACEKHDMVWVCLYDTPKVDLPEFEETQLAEMVPTRVEYTPPWDASLPRMVQSALDDYHFPWIHEGVLGSRDKPEAPQREIERTGFSLVSSFSQLQPSNVTNSVGGEVNETLVAYEMIVSMPNVIRLIKKGDDGGTYVVIFFPSPVSYNKTAIFWRVVRNYKTTVDDEEQILQMEAFIQSQDRMHVSGQKCWSMRPFPVADVDAAIMEYLNWLEELDIPANI